MRCSPIRGVSVCLRANYQDLLEHAHEEDVDGDLTTASSYIEAVSGQTFSLVVTVEPRFAHFRDDLRIQVRVDGKVMINTLRDARSMLPIVIEGATNSTIDGDTLQRFTFSDLETSAYIFASTPCCH